MSPKIVSHAAPGSAPFAFPPVRRVAGGFVVGRVLVTYARQLALCPCPTFRAGRVCVHLDAIAAVLEETRHAAR